MGAIHMTENGRTPTKTLPSSQHTTHATQFYKIDGAWHSFTRCGTGQERGWAEMLCSREKWPQGGSLKGKRGSTLTLRESIGTWQHVDDQLQGYGVTGTVQL